MPLCTNIEVYRSHDITTRHTRRLTNVAYLVSAVIFRWLRPEFGGIQPSLKRRLPLLVRCRMDVFLALSGNLIPTSITTPHSLTLPTTSVTSGPQRTIIRWRLPSRCHGISQNSTPPTGFLDIDNEFAVSNGLHSRQI